MNTMKTLYFLRHAKSDWSQPFQRDFDRSLNERGLKDAPVIARFVQNAIGLKGLHIVSSPAKRTKETLQPIEEMLAPTQQIVWNANLYESGANEYLKVIRDLPEEADKVMMIGHNPSIEDAAEALINGTGYNQILQVPTGCLMCLELSISRWKTVSAGCASLQWMVNPRLMHKVMK